MKSRFLLPALLSRFALLFAAMVLAAGPFHAAEAQPVTGRDGKPLAGVPLDAFRDMIAAMRQGGLVMLIRHERTELPSREDDYSRSDTDCRAQRNLSVAGTAGAAESGVVFRALEIPVGRVIASPMCRATETARGMFGVGYETDRRMLHQDPDGARNLAVASAEMRELLVELAPGLPGTNIALVGHGGMIHQLTGVQLSEGEVVLVRLAEGGAVTVVGHFLPSDLNPFVRDALKAN
ncbi:hypothetical protein [Porphyrobacter sp. HT-58-2]|uniref:hypothetical protein n=1 Tax=Porphyrobacter sp. HT-58-2 TaxID=2023229 RepID=UPI0011B04F5C|nr:hypothetical protein [Porphyrobacter sp. HT-58-2]